MTRRPEVRLLGVVLFVLGCADVATPPEPAAIAAVSNPAAAKLPPYTPTDLGALPPPTDSSQAEGINDRGFVAGWSETPGSPFHATMWTPQGNIIDLGTLGGSYSMAMDINRKNDVVGFSGIIPGTLSHRATLWPYQGTPVNLGTLPGGTLSLAGAINDVGVIVGASNSATSVYLLATRWSNGAITELGTPPGDFESSASGLNAAGDAVGCSTTAASQQRPLKWPASGGIVTLALPPGMSSGCAAAINSSGEIAGFVAPGPAIAAQAVKWAPNGTVQILPAPAGSLQAFAAGINKHGDVVGWSVSAASESALLWESNGTMRVLAPLPGGTRARAGGINDRATVVGFSTGTGFPAMHATCWAIRRC